MDGYSGGKGGGKTETRNCFKCCKVGHLSHQCRVGNVRGVDEPEEETIGQEGLIEWGDTRQVEWENNVEDLKCLECEGNWTGEWEEIEQECWNIGDVMEVDGEEGPDWRENVKGG